MGFNHFFDVFKASIIVKLINFVFIVFDHDLKTQCFVRLLKLTRWPLVNLIKIPFIVFFLVVVLMDFPVMWWSLSVSACWFKSHFWRNLVYFVSSLAAMIFFSHSSTLALYILSYIFKNMSYFQFTLSHQACCRKNGCM